MRTPGRAFWRSILFVFGLATLVAAGEAQNAFNDGVKLYRAGKFKEAIAAFALAATTDKDHPVVWNDLGTAWLSSGHPDKALSSFRRALHIAPNYALAHYNLGAAQDQLRDYENALQSYARALELDPTLADPAVNPSIVNNKHMVAVHTILYQKQIGALGAAMPPVTQAGDQASRNDRTLRS